MMGSALIGFIGGLHHWWPKMFGKMYDENLGRIAFVLVFIGFNVTFFTQFMLGSHGMPRRYYDYQPEFTTYHLISTIGSYIMAAGFFLTAMYLDALALLRTQGPRQSLGWSKPRVAVHLASPA